jgi:hypothetical protein
VTEAEGEVVAVGRLDQLAKAMGVPVQAADVDHWARFELYLAALAHGGAAIEPLRQALKAEPDECLLYDLPWTFTERATSPEQRAVAFTLPFGEARRAELEKHAAEIDLVAAVLGGARVEQGAVGGWSQWVQHRVTDRCTDPKILSQIADEGTTRRVRAEAAEKVRRIEVDAAARADDPDLLRRLAEHGSSHAVRRLATARLRASGADRSESTS